MAGLLLRVSFLLQIVTLTLLWLPSSESAQLESYKVSYSQHHASKNCPCSNPQWCEPITRTGKEVFAFSQTNDIAHWKLYDWSKVTTIVMFGYVNQSLMCLAHSHGVRVVFLGSVSKTTFMDPSLRKKWIAQQISIAKQNFLDGINFDYENVIQENETDTRNAYTALVRETNMAFRKEMPHFQVTVDVAWKPNIDVRFYDYVGLAENSDFLFVMAYDEQSQIFGECLALPNSPLPQALDGLVIYLQKLTKEIPSSKLVLGVPWYGYHYPCTKKEGEKCYIREVPFRGVNCSDAAGSQISYAEIAKMLKTSKPKWNASSSTPYFDCTMQSGQPCQVQFDSAYSLSLKYLLALKLGLRGVGMYNIDLLDYTDTIEAAKIRQEMFAVLPATKIAPNLTRSSQEPLQKLLRFEARQERRPKALSCPCSDLKLCEPIKTTRKEVFAFTNENNATKWHLFDWSKLTTVVMFNYINTSLMCLAHSHGVRAVALGSVDQLTVVTPTLRHLWVQQQVQIVQDNFLDGLNFDYEHTMLPPEQHYRDAFTDLIKQTVSGLRSIQPYAQVSVCTVVNASNPNMAYDYPELAKSIDFFFIMAYDESGTLQNGPDSDYYVTQAGVESFLKKNISATKLVMGLPWYGDVYQCVSLHGDDCVIEAAGKGFGQWGYDRIMGVLETMPDRYRWNESSLTPYFTYTEKTTNISRIIQYDNPRSLTLKYQLAGKMGIRGVGMFLIDLLDYSDTPHGAAQRKAMFDPLPVGNSSEWWRQPLH